MKKLLSFVLLTFVGLSNVLANYTRVDEGNDVTLTWDFAEFGSTESSFTSPYDYNGLTLVMTYQAGKDIITASGFKGLGASTTTNRYIAFTPEMDGTIIVSFRSNNQQDAANRITAIGTEIVVGATEKSDKVVAIGNSSVGSIICKLTGGTTYYIYFSVGGQTITKIEYDYVDPNTRSVNMSACESQSVISNLDRSSENTHAAVRNVGVLYDYNGKTGIQAGFQTFTIDGLVGYTGIKMSVNRPTEAVLTAEQMPALLLQP